MNGANNWVLLSIDVLLVQMALDHDLRKVVLPDLPLSLNNLILLLNFRACFLLNITMK
jgi:hypothetical protein